jgi:hypothetical protein
MMPEDSPERRRAPAARETVPKTRVTVAADPAEDLVEVGGAATPAPAPGSRCSRRRVLDDLDVDGSRGIPQVTSSQPEYGRADS